MFIHSLYSFVKPQFIDAENAQNYHIFEGHIDPRDGHFVSSNRKSCCGKYHCTSPSAYEIVFLSPNEDLLMKVRKIAKWHEDRGEKVCGQCVATLFSDNI